ncbi:MAG: 3-oxoacyl-[acyl-carrier-protein] synthase-3 [Planctomycetota bacterium]|jgi:3-oxoacyl-[acyl-carrier-protein] synthase-3
MSDGITVGIAGCGHYVPDRVVPNSYFEDYVDTSDEWIRQRTGIVERRFAAEGQVTSDMCKVAAKMAMERAGITAEELDLIVVGTVSPDQYLPAVAPMLQDYLGAKNCAAFDVTAACTGFITALNVVHAMIRSGAAKTALVFGAETLSKFIDLTDRGSCILFGDGAGCVVLKAQEPGLPGEILKVSLGSDGSGYELIQMTGGGALKPASAETIGGNEHAIHVRGREVFRFAVTTMARTVSEMMEGHDPSDLGLLVPHQVNARIIDAAAERLDIPADKIMVNIQKYGNTSAASVPIALSEAYEADRLIRGKLVVMCAFGAGLNWGGALVRW